ncbi:regulator of volume decrease after cellular swelling-domain-containing protein [Flagelloscypha sp. PMI_526]|nr:regulator of volume decrease after cellular swelling-domain-containing protein [Flagelloscypha sp. PMI_526]
MPLTIISELPPFVTLEQHAELSSSTPQSFSDIPSVIRLQLSNIAVDLQPPLPDFGLADGQAGALYVLESVLIFMSSTGKGLQIDYRTITLHAISKSNGTPCIYCQLDNEGKADTDEEMELSELNIVPQNASDLEPIFEALSYCATLHPDPMTDEDEDGDAFISSDTPFDVFNPEDEAQELSEVGKVRSDFINNSRYAPY